MTQMMIPMIQTIQMMMRGKKKFIRKLTKKNYFFVSILNNEFYCNFVFICSTENSENEDEDETSDVEQKKHSPHNDGKSKKSNLIEDDNDSVSKLTEAAEKLEKILSVDLNTEDLTDRSKIGGAHDDKGVSGGSNGIEITRQSPKNSDKMESGGRAFGMQQRGDNSNRTTDKFASNDKNILRSDLLDDNHSNISDSDVGDFPDDLDDSSNDSVKSSNSHGFVSRLTHKPNDVPMKSDSGAHIDVKSDVKGGGAATELPYETMSFLDDLNTSDTTDSNSSEKGLKCSNAFNLMRDCTTTTSSSTSAATAKPVLDSSRDTTSRGDEPSPLVKTSPTSDAKLKSVSSCIGLSMDSAIGSKSVDDDNAMSDLHTDNISDDEYDDIKPDNLTLRKDENTSIRNNENFESIAQYISPAPISLNTLISADYSNSSDNNDTNSNDNRDSNDSKRTENSPSILKPASHDSSRITDKDIMEPGELLGKTLLESQDSNLTCESLPGGDHVKSAGKSTFLTDNKVKTENLIDDTVNLINIDSTKKTDGFSMGAVGAAEAIASKTDFSSLHSIKGNECGDIGENKKGNNSSGTGGGGNNKQETCNPNEKPPKTDDEIYELNFLDEHSMNDSNQSGILGMHLMINKLFCFFYLHPILIVVNFCVFVCVCVCIFKYQFIRYI